MKSSFPGNKWMLISDTNRQYKKKHRRNHRNGEYKYASIMTIQSYEKPLLHYHNLIGGKYFRQDVLPQRESTRRVLNTYQAALVIKQTNSIIHITSLLSIFIMIILYVRVKKLLLSWIMSTNDNFSKQYYQYHEKHSWYMLILCYTPDHIEDICDTYCAHDYPVTCYMNEW